ncbi:MAG: peptidylprolyl isomerase [Deltaproteobacteria bacterium]|nr:peptidylprolyl isomerase [Deltaproteobacteria bacterium]
MSKVKKGDFVAVHYWGTLENGEMFDSSEGRDPLEFQVGAGTVIEGFEKAVQGLSVGDKKNFALQPEDAYGPKDESLVVDFPRASAEKDISLEVGGVLGVRLQNGQQIPARITNIGDDNITLDMNPPLAGKVLNFQIEVVHIGDGPKFEEACSCGCSDTSCSGC